MPSGKRRHDRDDRRRGERGALLAGMATLVAILGIFSLLAFQEYAEVLRRDKEAEMIFRAQEIVRAIQRYRLDRGGTAPTSLEQLIEPGTKGQYYIRRLYEDPLVKDGKWGLLFVGPGNQIVDPNAEEADPATLAALGGNQGLGAFNQGQRSGQGGPGRNTRPDAPGTQNQKKPPGQQGAGGLQGRPGGLGGVGNPGGGAETGLPIAGVRTLADDEPFRVYNGLTEYEEWLFTYFDLENAQVPGQGGRRRPGAGAAGRGGNLQQGGTGLGGNRPSGFGNDRRNDSRNRPNNRPTNSPTDRRPNDR